MKGDSRNAKRLKTPKHEELEDALVIWINQVIAKHGCVVDAKIKKQAAIFGTQMGITNFNYSSGWLSRFKQRRGLTQTEEIINEVRQRLSAIISEYEPQNVYNMDETSLFYRMQPDKSISSGPIKAHRKVRDRIMLVFCTNADGSDKRTLTVIGKSKKPKCFRNFNPALYVVYRHNRKAWMTAIEFSEWLKQFNVTMKRENRKVLLLLDNATYHKNETLSNVKIEYFPLNCIGVLQPLDAGIIKYFKVHYRRYQVKHIIECINDNKPTLLQLNDALYMIKKAWDEVKPETIHNCWAHTGLIKRIFISISEDNSVRELKVALKQFNACASIDLPMTIEEFLAVDDDVSTHEDTSADDIVQIVCSGVEDKNSSEEDGDTEDSRPIPTRKEAEEGLEILRKFLEKHCNDSSEMCHIIALDNLIGKINEKKRSRR